MRDRRVVGPAGFTRLLLARGERGQVPLPLTRRRAPAGGPAPRVRWMAEAVKKDAIGWLFRQGGWQRRQVVAGGRRREGRLTDAGVFERLDVRFTQAPLRLLIAAMEDPAPLPALDRGLSSLLSGPLATGDLVAVHRVVTALVREATASAAREVPAEVMSAPLRQLRLALPGCRRAWVVGPGGVALATDEDAPEDPAWAQAVQQAVTARAPDDAAGWARFASGVLLRAIEGAGRAWVACSVEGRPAGLRAALEGPAVTGALGQLGRALGRGTPRAVVEARRRELVRVSPLTCALSLEELGRGGDLDGATAVIAPLLAGDRAILWTYLDRAVARAWLDEETDRRRAPAAESQGRYAAAAVGASAFARAALAADRPDALRPLVRFFQGYVLRFGNRAPVVEALRERARAFDRASERDAFLATIAGLFAASRQVTAAIERTLGTPVVDRTEEEKVLLADWHEGFKSVADEMEAIRRELAGEIG